VKLENLCMNNASPKLSFPVTGKATSGMDSVINWKLILLPVLFVAVVFVAIKTVVHRHEARSLFVEAQRLEKERDVLAAQWSRLKLEQGTVLNQVSVERKARWDLGMHIPKASDIQMIREPFADYIGLVDVDRESKLVDLTKVSLSD